MRRALLRLQAATADAMRRQRALAYRPFDQRQAGWKGRAMKARRGAGKGAGISRASRSVITRPGESAAP
ncbi:MULTISPECIES: hypothetical protein [Burkholderia]|uniref:hypothetical protein n=1 Tax=Burkholderia TaxID=32008 RepID=UPI001E34EEF2|nr:MULTISPECIES: hypothetical protein [unclassified Burkholderia]UEP30737.1 hypothetical protein LMA01_30620 [Burkholderia sp. B21-007]